MSDLNHAYQKSLTYIQGEANDYASTVLRFYKSDSPDLPALPDAEAVCFNTVQSWLDAQYEMPTDIRDQVAGAALGHAREEWGTFWGDDTLLTLNEV